jgi:hypothetical protein
MVLGIFFVAWALPGLLLSSQIMPMLQPRLVEEKTSMQPVVQEDQIALPLELKNQKILLISTKNSAANLPKLNSVWGLFISFGDRPNLILKEIYSFGQDDTLALQDHFQLNSDGQVSPRFIAVLGQLNVAWDGTILIDEPGLEILANWMDGYLQSAQTNSDSSHLNVTSQNIPQGFCAVLNSPLSSSQGNTPPWEILFSGGMNTDLPVSSITNGWQALVKSQSSPYCEIISANLN